MHSCRTLAIYRFRSSYMYLLHGCHYVFVRMCDTMLKSISQITNLLYGSILADLHLSL